MTPAPDPAARNEGDPSAMGEAQPLPPLRSFRARVKFQPIVKARTVQDAIDLARNRWGDDFTGTVEAM